VSKELSRFQFSLDQCEHELAEFAALLDRKDDLSERDDLLPFFRSRPHLAAFAASWNLHIADIDMLGFEFDLFGSFRCDWAAGHAQSGEFALVEIEDARPHSVFGGGDKYHDEWGRRFEHGYSQLIDWSWALDMYRDNVDFRKRFGGQLNSFSGLLLIGRSKYLDPTMRGRLHWRVQRVSVNSSRIICMTFDDFREQVGSRVRALRAIAKPKD
jgi:hypothetical protein